MFLPTCSHPQPLRRDWRANVLDISHCQCGHCLNSLSILYTRTFNPQTLNLGSFHLSAFPEFDRFVLQDMVLQAYPGHARTAYRIEALLRPVPAVSSLHDKLRRAFHAAVLNIKVEPGLTKSNQHGTSTNYLILVIDHNYTLSMQLFRYQWRIIRPVKGSDLRSPVHSLLMTDLYRH